MPLGRWPALSGPWGDKRDWPDGPKALGGRERVLSTLAERRRRLSLTGKRHPFLASKPSHFSRRGEDAARGPRGLAPRPLRPRGLWPGPTRHPLPAPASAPRAREVLE